jgi:hypothetical protein
MTFITEIENSSLNFIWKQKRSRIAKAIVSKNSNIQGITIPNFILQSYSNKNSMVLAQKQI